MNIKGTCWNCNTDLDQANYGRQETCPKCGKDSRVCLNCSFHDRSYNNECREPQADRVVDKDKSNFCDYFNPKSGHNLTPGKTQESLKSAAETLFKKK